MNQEEHDRGSRRDLGLTVNVLRQAVAEATATEDADEPHRRRSAAAVVMAAEVVVVAEVVTVAEVAAGCEVCRGSRRLPWLRRFHGCHRGSRPSTGSPAPSWRLRAGSGP